MGYWVQIRAFREAGGREAALSAEAINEVLPFVHLAHISSETDPYSYKLWLGPFADKNSADTARNALRGASN
jgi:hypothetical protein